MRSFLTRGVSAITYLRQCFPTLYAVRELVKNLVIPGSLADQSSESETINLAELVIALEFLIPRRESFSVLPFSPSCEKFFLNNFIVLKRRCNLRLFMFIGVKEFVGININRVPSLYRASQCNFSLDEPSSYFLPTKRLRQLAILLIKFHAK